MKLKSRPLGVSVYYLSGQFLNEIKEAGYDVTKTTANDLEPNLSSQDMGFISRKGQYITCPRDGEIGAAFVDCLKGPDIVGPSNIMLSYTWGDNL